MQLLLQDEERQGGGRKKKWEWDTHRLLPLIGDYDV